MKVKNRCPKCDGRIVAEAIGNYGTVFYLRDNGTIGHKLRSVKYEHTGEWLFYCDECGEQFDESVLWKGDE